MEFCRSGCSRRRPAKRGGATDGGGLHSADPDSQDHPGETEDAAGRCPDVSDDGSHFFSEGF